MALLPRPRYTPPALPDETAPDLDTSSDGALALKQLVPGLVLEGRYTLTEPIGAGGMAQVWEAMQTTTGRKVALKFVPLANSVAARRALREAQIVAKLRHPNVVELHDAFAIASPCDAVVLVLERLSGQSLQQALRSAGRLPFTIVADIGRCILQALALAHAQGIVHRDIKPSNVFVSSDAGWTAKVLDFGIAKSSRSVTATATQLTAHGGKPGTLAYMSPEQFLGESQITPAADVWATGVVLFEALTGTHPFRNGDTSDLVRNVLLGNSSAMRPLLETERLLVPSGIVDLIESMISVDASKRPKDAGVALARWNAAVETPFLSQDTGGSSVAIGDIIEGRYEVTHVIGQGGMAMVVGAKHLRLGTPVAIKFSYSELSASPIARERFLREAQAAASLKSPHVAKVSDFGILPDGTPFMVIEYLEGCDLSDRIRDVHTPLPLEEAIDCVVEACDALAEAHARGIVHRDVKPSNLFLANDARGTTTLKVLDFGIATAPTAGAGSLTQTTEAFGSPHYMSPEQIRGAKLVDARSDVWSLGIVLYELLTLHHPFVGDHPAAVVASIVADPAPRVMAMRAVAPALDEIVASCMSKNPLQRPQTVEELARLLAPFGGERARAVVARFAPSMAPASLARFSQPAGPASLAPHSLSSVTQSASSRPRWLLPAVAVASLFGVGVLAAVLSHQAEPAASPALASPAEPEAPPPVASSPVLPAVPPAATPVVAAPVVVAPVPVASPVAAAPTPRPKTPEVPVAAAAARVSAPKSREPAPAKAPKAGASAPRSNTTVTGGGSFD